MARENNLKIATPLFQALSEYQYSDWVEICDEFAKKLNKHKFSSAAKDKIFNETLDLIENFIILLCQK